MNLLKKSILVGAMALASLGATTANAASPTDLTIGPISMTTSLPKASELYVAEANEMEYVKQYGQLTYENLVETLGFSKAEVVEFANAVLNLAESNGESGLTPAQAKEVTQYLNKRYEQISVKLSSLVSEKNQAKGQEAFDKFVAEGAKVDADRPGIAYLVIEEGTGRQVKDTDVVKVTYKGSFVDGQVFDAALDEKAPAEFPLANLIPGFKYAATKLKVGGSVKVLIKPEEGYGMEGAGPIPPASTLVFEFKVLDAKPASK